MDSILDQVHKMVDDGYVSGLALSIYENRAWTDTIYGHTTFEGPKLEATHQFDIASITKLFTTTRILQLCDQGVLSLDAPIQKYINAFKQPDITITDCLLHRSGMAPSVTGRAEMNRDQIYKSVMDCKDLINTPNQKMVYSCINYLILGYIIDFVDTNLQASFDKSIFKPLKMSDTRFNPKKRELCVPTELTNKYGLIQGVVHDETARNCDGIAGNAGIFSTLPDLKRFMEAMLTSDPQLLSPKHYQLIRNTHIDSRSYGWNRYVYNGMDACYHTGFTGPVVLFHNERAMILLAHRVHPSREDHGYLKHRDALIQSFLHKKKK
ncbi:serine hydrolase [Erysipelothrix amsterdamensis]|uniref:Serine hydrolase n=1 Tax=Erysipelothrix amsterdamensis TaxID=2929157 RepID=A0AAU9VGX2_9FIRM|nr:serine hydrolase [Erysipelothrix sp. A18Y020d]CAH2760764.1 serine hydrolase [Erysipelothrix sp. A18Y020d]